MKKASIDDDKLFSNSKESFMAAPSFRVYYGDSSGAVPFTWESRPGTPKHPSSESDSNLPPLTPPPSYYYSEKEKSGKQKPPRTRSNLLRYVLNLKLKPLGQKAASRSTPEYGTASLPLSSSPSYSSFSSWSSEGHRGRVSSFGSSFDDEIDHEHQKVRNGGGGRSRSLKCYSSGLCFPHLVRNK